MSANAGMLMVMIGIFILFISSSIGAGAGVYFIQNKTETKTETGTGTGTGTVTGSWAGSGVREISANVTINGNNFDPTGYSVGKGWFWTPSTEISSSTPQISKSTDEATCEASCRSNPTCDHWASATITGVFPKPYNSCHLYKSNDQSDNAHVRAVKLRSNTIGLQVHSQGEGDQTFTSASMCKAKCDSDSKCVGWFHRNNNHSQPEWRNTCGIAYADNSNIGPQGFVVR
jgi:hypothetical protein